MEELIIHLHALAFSLLLPALYIPKMKSYSIVNSKVYNIFINKWLLTCDGVMKSSKSVN